MEKEVRENPALYGIVDPSPELCEIENAISAELVAMEAADKASAERAAAEKEEKLTAEAQEGEAPQELRELTDEKPLE